jgi:hypothetical protein
MPVQKRKKASNVISHRDFVRDLARGAVGEDVVVEFFKDQFGLCAENVSTRNPDYDLIVQSLDPSLSKKRNVVSETLLKKILREALDCPRRDAVTVEVKLDVAAAKYKNFFVEVFFDIATGSPGTIFKCKADVIAWVVPGKRGKYTIYLIKRPEFLAWFFEYISSKKVKLKTPSISPQARGVAIPISAVKNSFALIGAYEYKF